MRRFRALTPLLIALLALASVPGPWHGHTPIPVARVAGPSGAANTQDVIHAGIPHQSPHYVGTKVTTIEHSIERHDPLGRLLPRWSRPLDATPLAPFLLAGERSRARALERAHLDYAMIIAQARMGALSSRTTTLPPPFVT